MALIKNPNYNPNDPNSQQFVFDQPAVVNPQTGQLSNGVIPISTLSDNSIPANFKNPNPDLPIDISKLDTTILPTEPEKKADTFSTELQKINEALLGQSAFRAVKEKELDIEGLRKTQTDLSARLKAVQNEALAIPLQLQQAAEGRGITAGGLAPIQAGKLRENAIQALTVSSLLEASKGNLTLALDQVDRAVSAKYDPIREEREVKLANLDLVLKSPSYTLAEKNRAEKQKAILENQKKQQEIEQETQKEIGKIAVDAAANGADAETLAKIGKAKTIAEALQLAAPFLKKKEKPIIKDFEVGGRLKRQVLNPMTGEVISETDLGATGTPPVGGDKEKNIFTSTQTNKGASNAGLTIEEFNNLDNNLKNFFINPPTPRDIPRGHELYGQTLAEIFSTKVDNVENGNEKFEDVKNEILESNIPQVVKDYFISKLKAPAPKPSWWSRVRSWFK